MCDAPLRAQPLIRLLREIGNTPLSKELRRDTLRRRFIRNVFRPVFTELKMRALAIRLRPRATEAKITARCAMDLSPGTEIVPHRGFLTGSIRLITFTSRNQRASFIGSSEITLQQRPFSVPNPAIEALEIFDVIGE